jgi:hypothetical protein
MAITEVRRWKGNPEVAGQLMKEVAPIYKKHGAVALRMNICRYGAYAGQIFTVATYPDWATFGRVHQNFLEDEDMKRFRGELMKNIEMKNVELQESFVMDTEEF